MCCLISMIGGLLQAEEEDYSEEESSKVELKQDGNDSSESTAKAEKGEEKPDSKGTVTGERQSGDGQVDFQCVLYGFWGGREGHGWFYMEVGLQCKELSF